MSKEFHQTYLNESDTHSTFGELNIRYPIELSETEKKPRLHIAICSWRCKICAMVQRRFFFWGGGCHPTFHRRIPISWIYFKTPTDLGWSSSPIWKQWESKTRSHIYKEYEIAIMSTSVHAWCVYLWLSFVSEYKYTHVITIMYIMSIKYTYTSFT